jgi:hypothetical protein
VLRLQQFPLHRQRLPDYDALVKLPERARRQASWRASASAGSWWRRSIALAKALASFTGTSRPSNSCVTASRQPVASVVTNSQGAGSDQK